MSDRIAILDEDRFQYCARHQTALSGPAPATEVMLGDFRFEVHHGLSGINGTTRQLFT
jgi:hypothetical protein